MQLAAQVGRLTPEHLDGLERAERRVELGDVPVEGIEGRLDALTVVALPGRREVFDPGQRVRLVVVR